MTAVTSKNASKPRPGQARTVDGQEITVDRVLGRDCRECGGLAPNGRSCRRCGVGPGMLGGWVYEVSQGEGQGDTHEDSGGEAVEGDSDDGELSPQIISITIHCRGSRRCKTALQAEGYLDDPGFESAEVKITDPEDRYRNLNPTGDADEVRELIDEYGFRA